MRRPGCFRDSAEELLVNYIFFVEESVSVEAK
jgi:hypothetical protein